MSSLRLYYEEKLIGHLYENERHEVEFEYDSTWLASPKNFAISFSLPLAATTYRQEAQKFFSNLLPEGDVRTSVSRKLGVSPDNDFRLLGALGGECAGALTIGVDPTPLAAQYQELDVNVFKENYRSGNSVFSFMQSEEEGIRLSLAGAQDKLPVFYEDGALFLPQGNSPSSHILKPPSHRFKYLPENECLTGMFAASMGLNVPDSQLIDLDGVRVFLIDRYDRKYHGDRLMRLHQEDFCQALSFSYKVKYEKDGGPGFAKCYEVIESQSTNLPKDGERLIRWLIFNVLVGNCDAHAKNISFLMDESRQWSLAPHYDLVCTKAYSSLSKLMAMSIGGSYDSGTITGTHWRRLAREVQIGEKWLLATVEEMASLAVEMYDATSISFIEGYGKSPIVGDIRKVIFEQQRRVLSELKR